MLTIEAFNKLKLECAYSNGKYHISYNDKHYYVYVIIDAQTNTYYVGLSHCLYSRITQHIHDNTNGINTHVSSSYVFILEKLYYQNDMDAMEAVWISWFIFNAKCCNLVNRDIVIRRGLVNTSTIINSNYEKLVLSEIIYPIKLHSRLILYGIEDRDNYNRDQPFY